VDCRDAWIRFDRHQRPLADDGPDNVSHDVVGGIPESKTPRVWDSSMGYEQPRADFSVGANVIGTGSVQRGASFEMTDCAAP
jgi:hypothetical protein